MDLHTAPVRRGKPAVQAGRGPAAVSARREHHRRTRDRAWPIARKRAEVGDEQPAEFGGPPHPPADRPDTERGAGLQPETADQEPGVEPGWQPAAGDDAVEAD